MKLQRIKQSDLPRARLLLGEILPFAKKKIFQSVSNWFLLNTPFYVFQDSAKNLNPENHLVGFFTFKLFGKKFKFIRYLIVHPSHRSQGIGKKILEMLVQKSQPDYLLCLSNPLRKRAHKFYFREGFQRFAGFFFWKKCL